VPSGVFRRGPAGLSARTGRFPSARPKVGHAEVRRDSEAKGDGNEDEVNCELDGVNSTGGRRRKRSGAAKELGLPACKLRRPAVVVGFGSRTASQRLAGDHQLGAITYRGRECRRRCPCDSQRRPDVSPRPGKFRKRKIDSSHPKLSTRFEGQPNPGNRSASMARVEARLD